ncbi:MAG: glycosyltransferase family 39 protein [Candidatus Woesebacteria bacterium]
MKLRQRKMELIFIVLLCLVALFLRSYALPRDLVFAYDQGRDAFVEQRILHGHFTLIGPTTGLDGVFLGPFYYYLIFPFYFISGGNPLFAAYLLVLFHVALVAGIYFFARKIAGPLAGAIAAILFTFSSVNINYARWLSNPTPLPFFALCAFGSLWIALERKKTWIFILTGVLFGLCFQLEAANALWFVPTAAIILATDVWVSEKKNKFRYFLTRGLLLTLGFILASIPQILFELKWNFLITRNVLRSFRETHDVSVLQSLPRRIPLLYTLFAKAIFPKAIFLFSLVCIGIVIRTKSSWKQLKTNRGLRIALIWLFVPLFFETIYTGNHGNFWDYYILAQHAVLYIVIGSFIALGSKGIKIIGCLLLAVSVCLNLSLWSRVFIPYSERFSLQKEVESVNWIIDDANGKPYGVWVYTPSYQDEAGRYVIWWVGQKRKVFPEVKVEQQPYIYLMVDNDSTFWKRRLDWIADKETFGQVLEEKRIGAFTLIKIQNKYWHP